MRLSWQQRARRDEGCELVRLSCRAGALLAAHDHDYPELFWIEDGVCTHLVDGTRSELAVGSLVFIRPDHLHQLRAEGAAFTVCNVTLNPVWAAELAQRQSEAWRWAWPPQGGPRVVQLPPTDLAQVREWFESLWQQVPDRLATEGFLLDLLRLVRPSRRHAYADAPLWLRDGLARLRDPAVFQGGVPALAKAAGVSREHLARACRRFLKRTPSALVAEAKLEFACRHLRHGDLTVAEVAATCGYGGPAQFYRDFAARFGCSPAKWRARTGGDSA